MHFSSLLMICMQAVITVNLSVWHEVKLCLTLSSEMTITAAPRFYWGLASCTLY